MTMAQADFIKKIPNVLGLSAKQREVLSDDTYDTISTIIHMNYNETCEWCTTKSKLTITRRGASYGDQKIKCIWVLSRRATNLTLSVKHIVLVDFDATIMTYGMDEAKFDYEDGKKEPDIKKPDKYSHSKWVAWEEMVYTYFTATKKHPRGNPWMFFVAWEEMVYTYFTATKNIQGLPLGCVLCKTPSPSITIIDR